MAAKHFIIKKIVLPIVTVAIIASQIIGCAAVPKNELLEQIYAGDEVVIEMADPNWAPASAEQLSDLSWVQLDQLNLYSNSGFRGNVDTIFNISTVTTQSGNTKNGCMYVVDKNGEEVQSGNTCMRDAFRNKQFIKYWEDSNTRNELAELVGTAYTDVDATNSYAMQAVINAYYNLFNDGDNDSTYGGEQSLTREQFMTMLFKAGNGVKSLTTSDSAAFKQATGGESYYTRYAAQMKDHSYLKIDNGSLNGTNIATPISKLEAIYMVVDTYLKSEVDKVIGTEKLNAYGYSDAGDQIKDLKLDGDKVSKAVENNLMAYLVDTQGEDGIDHTLMAYLTVAEQNGLTDGIDVVGEVFDSISKDEAIRLIANTFIAENNLYGYLTNGENGTVETVDGAGLQDTEVPEDTTVEAQTPDEPEVNPNFDYAAIYADLCENHPDTASAMSGVILCIPNIFDKESAADLFEEYLSNTEHDPAAAPGLVDYLLEKQSSDSTTSTNTSTNTDNTTTTTSKPTTNTNTNNATSQPSTNTSTSQPSTNTSTSQPSTNTGSSTNTSTNTNTSTSQSSDSSSDDDWDRYMQNAADLGWDITGESGGRHNYEGEDASNYYVDEWAGGDFVFGENGTITIVGG